MYTLDQLNTRKASETPYTFEFTFDGKPSGIMLSVVGQQSETFTQKATELGKKFALAEGIEKANEFLPSSRNRELIDRLAAARLIEWAGIADTLTDETAYQFVRDTAGAFEQIVAASNKIGNFIQL